jgi:hypothetical protein
VAPEERGITGKNRRGRKGKIYGVRKRPDFKLCVGEGGGGGGEEEEEEEEEDDDDDDEDNHFVAMAIRSKSTS